MRVQWYALTLVLPAVFSVFSPLSLVSASPALSDQLSEASSEQSTATGVIQRDGHGHHNPHAAPLLELNETEVTMHHAPTPPSYYTIDWDSRDPSASRYPGLMITHAIFMSLAFFVVLPVGIAMRSVKHPWHGAVVILFFALSALGCAANALYMKLTPNMYEGSAHGSHGYLALLLALLLSAVDMLALIRRVIVFAKKGENATLKIFWSSTILGRAERNQGPEYTGLISEEPEEFEEPKSVPLHSPCNEDHVRILTQNLGCHGETANWANEAHRHTRDDSQSISSERTIFSPRSPDSDHTVHGVSPKHSRLRQIGEVVFATLERVLVVAGFVQLLTGIVVYTGGCRRWYINGCLAHLIKGGIFWCYGLLTFARFLGSFSELGWAWNRAPSGKVYSAEFVESALIFTYGITNTWMERFGANRGDPFTTKQVQHISIAVMFWFAGLVGMGLESKTMRKWLALPAVKSSKLSQEAITEPPSYSANFNPFPALVIGVTGAAMAAHHQTYLFQVQIHALWGNLLVGFSILRCLTYFFLWLGPPRSILPSRPPTEALGSFFLACGGLVFMFSTEEVTFAAMRRGRDDVMMFLNVAVAITCFAFCWTLSLVAFKGWLRSRTHATVSYHDSA